MCGPATVPITFACTPKWPSASTRLRRRLRLPGRVRARLLAGRARQQLARVGHLPDEARVVGDRVAQAALRRQRRRRRCAPRPVIVLVLLLVPAPRRLVGLLGGGPSRARSSGASGCCGSSDAPRQRVVLLRRAPRRASRARPARRCRARGGCTASTARRRVAQRPSRGVLGSRRRCPSAAHHARRVRRRRAGRAQRAAERGAGDQRSRRRAAGTRPGCPTPTPWTSWCGELVERLADDAAVGLQVRRVPGRVAVRRAGADAERAGGERERGGGEQAARRSRAGRRSGARLAAQALAQQQHAAGADQRERREHARFAERPAERRRRGRGRRARRPSRRRGRSP